MGQVSIKFTNEAPEGLKAGVKRSYYWVNQDMLDACSMPQWRNMLYSICFLHSIVQERRKFGAMGFSVPYEFNQSDLSASVTYIQNHLNDIEAKKRPIDWPTVHYIVCEVMYGGRITCDWDRRTFNNYGYQYLDPRTLASGYELFKGYTIAVGTEIDHFRRHVESLPPIDSPEVFGLHSNADITCRTLGTNMLLSTIIDILPKEGGGGGGMSREEVVLKTVDELQSKCPPNYVQYEVDAHLKELGARKPLSVTLRQEIERVQMVLLKIRSTLSDLKLAIAGTIIMSPGLATALNCLFDARIPPLWTKVSALEAPNLGVWFNAIMLRCEQWTNWLQKGKPFAYLLAAFFNPQGFLTANRQEVCRAHQGWALDDVVDSTEVSRMEREELKKAPAEGVYICGLYLEGCKWDKAANKLVDSDPKVLYAQLPCLLASGCLKSEKKLDANSYNCPVYKYKRRGSGAHGTFIFAADIRSEDKPMKWVLRGVALLATKE